ncbi:hydrogenase/urease maturation nickel metallochaperone HypA [Luminiphilus syltensis]|uniref:hydrogenase/urease maturation nickel metallochaperone HypA n=1 Tax=Luminiphilus syltensis TaxID=1341119 RepID=UPI000590EF47|nr:hydrogenase/urease maturation nickel metallochaperone HypA [Luminiphilus syltensis]
MHEASLMNDLMEKIARIARQEAVARVTGVDVWLGALSHMSADHFRQHFEESCKGSIAEGADLHIEVSTDINHPDAQAIALKSIEADD